MSFIISLYVREGIVMASDSRLTLNTNQKQGKGQIVSVATGMSDSNYKTFLSPQSFGISTFGQAHINGVPITGFIETFITDNGEEESVTRFAEKLKDHFRNYQPIPNTGFHVAGYETEKGKRRQKLFRVFPDQDKCMHLNPEKKNGQPVQGASWDGESDILVRLIQQVYTKDEKGSYQPLPQYNIPWAFFTLQDAIDFAVYAIRSTIESVKFQPRAKTVGGPIDVLVIKPNEAKWISRKDLKVA